MKLGVLLPQHEADGKTLLDAARYAEDSGLDSVWVVDHLHGLPEASRPVLECWTSICAVMSATSRVTAGTLVMRVGLRLPAMVSSMAASAMKVSDGRFVAGLGIGDETSIREQKAYGIGWKPKGERLAELDQLIASLSALEPPVPVWIGGTSRDLFARAGKVQAMNLWVKVDELPDLLERSGGLPEGTQLTWGGNWPGADGLSRLEQMGVDHAIIATGAGNYRTRIDNIAAFAN